MARRKRTSTDLSAGVAVADWIERYCTHTKGEWAGRPLTLEGWQRHEIIEPLFGQLQPDGLRQYRTALIGIPRKAGKSTLGASIALRLLFADNEPGVEVYSAAADKDQARIVYEMARSMVEASPAMSKRCKVYRNEIATSKGGRYKVLSADAFTKHGLSPHGVIFDELHAQPDRELWDVLTSGQGARRQPLTVAITTAGYDRQSLCYELFEHGHKVSTGQVDDPNFFFRWWGADEGDEWDDEATWAKAQPNLGVSVYLEFMRSEARQARALPRRQNTFRRLYLNQWTAAETRWIDLGLWDENAGIIDEAKLRDRRCWGALDLASTEDFTAWLLVFPNDDGTVELLPRFFLPRAALDRRRAMTATLEQWEREGFLTVTDGDVTDYAAIEAQALRDAETFQLVDFAYDPWQGEYLRQRLMDAGLVGWKCPQQMAHLSPPSKLLERLLGERRLRHGGNPILRWMADNVQTTTDANGNIRPDKRRSSEKIDGITALVMGLAAAFREQPSTVAPATAAAAGGDDHAFFRPSGRLNL